MDRRDVKRSRFVGISRGGSTEIHTGTVELNGTSAEANMLVDGLRLLLLERQKQELLTNAAQGIPAIQELLDSIKEPNYAAEARPLAG